MRPVATGIILLAISVLMGGCVSAESSAAAANSASTKAGLVCKKETPIGSKRPVTVCRTVAQLEEEREDAKARLKEGRTTGQLNNM